MVVRDVIYITFYKNLWPLVFLENLLELLLYSSIVFESNLKAHSHQNLSYLVDILTYKIVTGSKLG